MKLSRFEIGWMVIFGIACGALMIHEHIFNGIVVLPLIPLIVNGIERMLEC